MKRIILNFLLVIVSVSITLVGIELVLRYMFSKNTSESLKGRLQSYYAEKICLAPPSFKKKGSARMLDPFVGFRFRPNAKVDATMTKYNLYVQLDELGFRSNNGDFTGDEELLWFLGDSNTFCMVQEIEDTFPKVVENQLNELSQRTRFRALLHGVVGWGTVNVSKHVYQLKPSLDYRMAILGFCVSNDVINNLWYKEGSISTPVVQDTATVSRIMNELSFPFLYRSVLLRLVLNRLPIEYFLRYDIMIREESLERTRRELDRLLEVTGENKLVVVIFPLLSQITDSWVARWCQLDKINQMVISWCEENDVPCLDLLDYLEGHTEYYYPEDNHYNAEGNHKVGEMIADFLVRNAGILDRHPQ